MNDAQKILECISANPGLSDRQITNLIFGENHPQQKINAICRKLAEQGLIIRTMRPVKNYIKNSDDEAQPLNQISRWKFRYSESWQSLRVYQVPAAFA